MERLLKKNLNKGDETRTFEKGKLEVATLGEVVVGRATFEPGWRWSKHIKPIAGTTSCEAAHNGYIVSGKMRIVMDDGTALDVGPGDAFVCAPGHDAWVVGDQPCVALDFGGFEHYAKAPEAAQSRRR